MVSRAAIFSFAAVAVATAAAVAAIFSFAAVAAAIFYFGTEKRGKEGEKGEKGGKGEKRGNPPQL